MNRTEMPVVSFAGGKNFRATPTKQDVITSLGFISKFPASTLVLSIRGSLLGESLALETA